VSEYRRATFFQRRLYAGRALHALEEVKEFGRVASSRARVGRYFKRKASFDMMSGAEKRSPKNHRELPNSLSRKASWSVNWD
jgi:hypothetical protein